MPQEPPLLAREEKRLLALHRVGSLIRHMKRVGAQISIRRLITLVEQFVVMTQLLEHATPLLQQPLLEILQLLLGHWLRLLLTLRRSHATPSVLEPRGPRPH